MFSLSSARSSFAVPLLCLESSLPAPSASSAVLRKRRFKNTSRASFTKRPCDTSGPNSRIKQSSFCRYGACPALAQPFPASVLGFLGWRDWGFLGWRDWGFLGWRDWGFLGWRDWGFLGWRDWGFLGLPGGWKVLQTPSHTAHCLVSWHHRLLPHRPMPLVRVT